MHDFFLMGGYAAYIWPSWLVGVIILGGITLASIRRYKHANARLGQLTDARMAGEGKAEHG